MLGFLVVAVVNSVEQQQTPPFVSVIVPVFNDPERIALCVEALLTQTYPHERYEIVVIDNGSTDATCSVIQRYGVTLLVEDQKQSSYAARNKGLHHARGEILAFTDSDCIPASDWLAAGVARLVAMPHTGLVGGKIDLFFKNARQPTAAELYDRVTAFPQQAFIEKEHFGATANVFTFRHIFDRVGVFNDTLKSGGDREWGNRVFAAGCPLIYAEEACVQHPARDSLDELYRKAMRVTEGLYQLNQKHNRSLIKLLKGVAWELIPPWNIITQIYTDKHLTRHDQRLKALSVLLAIKFLRAWGRIRLYRAYINARA